MLIQRFHPALRPGHQLTQVRSDNPLFSRQGHWDSGSALHCVAMALALLDKLADPVRLARSDGGPEANFWDCAWPHYLHGLTPSELESFIWELNLGVRPVALSDGRGPILNFCERELKRSRPVIVGWRRRRVRDACVFHAKPNADSTANRARIPQQSERRFHGKPSRDSTTARARIPRVTEQ